MPGAAATVRGVDDDVTTSSSVWPRRVLFVAVSWIAAAALMAAVAVGVTSLLTPDPLPDDLSAPPSAPEENSEREDPDDPAAVFASPLAPGTCTDELVRPDDGLSAPVVVVDCDDPHTAEVVAQLPAAIPADRRADACADAAATAGVPVTDPDPKVPFRVGVFETAAGTLECTLSTSTVTGSVSAGGYDTLTALDDQP